MLSLATQESRDLIARRHPEWREFARTWRWLLDSYEGGERYRNAVYGYDRRGMEVRNLIRHKREYPDPREQATLLGTSSYPAGLANGAGDPRFALDRNQDAYTFANDNDYELRRARTPVPTFLREAVETHLSKVFSKEVARKGPAALEAWWEDVDGRGTPIATWVQQEIAPLFLSLGQLDLLVDHPPAPAGEAILTQADQARTGVGRAVASYILPENLLWWRKDPAGRYVEALVQEYVEEPTEAEIEQARSMETTQAGAQGRAPAGNLAVRRYRHWTAKDSTLYDNIGNVLAVVPHAYGRPPIVRVFDRKKARCGNAGQSRYEGIAERQREYYNRDSELILSDTIQAHPLLQGPEDLVKPDGSIPIGPGYLLPMKKNGTSAGASYQGFETIDFPKGASESLRQNKQDLREDVDRDACLTKPAGASGTGKTTVAQSGISKQIDHQGGHELMTQLVEALGRLETILAELVLRVLADGAPSEAEIEAIDVVYPTTFALQSAAELAQGLTDFQSLLATAGECPELESLWLKEIAKENLKGQDAATYETIYEEIEEAVAAKAKLIEERNESMVLTPGRRAMAPDRNAPGNAESGAGDEPMTSPAYMQASATYGS